MSPIKIAHIEKNPTREQALEAAKSLVTALESGEIVAFGAVGIEADDCTRMWSGSSRPVTRLRMMGALYNLLNHYTNDAE